MRNSGVNTQNEIGVASDPKLSSQLYSKCLKVLHGIIELFIDFGYERNPNTQRQIAKTCNHWTRMALEFGAEGWLKVAKYKTAAFFAAHAHNIMDAQDPVPPPGKSLAWQTDSPAVMFGGHIWKWCKDVLFRQKESTIKSFLSTFLLLKKGLLRPEAYEMELARRSTYDKLTKPVSDNPLSMMGTWNSTWLNAPNARSATQVEYQVTAITAIEQLQRTVREVFKGKIFNTSELYVPFLPSTNANYNMSRNRGGALGEMYAHEDLLGWLETDLDDDDDQVYDMINRWYDGVRFSQRTSREADDETFHGFQFKDSVDATGYHKIYSVDTSRLDHRFKSAMIHMRILADKEPALASLVALSEALKVRVISKGPPLTYTVLKPIQKWCWRVLRELAPTKLVGQPVDELYVHEQIGKNLGKDGKPKKVLSVDYSDASNTINPIATNTAWETICDTCGISDDLRRLGLKSLTGHLVVNPRVDYDVTKKANAGLDELQSKLRELVSKPDELWAYLDELLTSGAISHQTWAQLMGGILSFIILCLINLTVMRWTIEVDSGRTTSLKELPGCVNGDDGLGSVEHDSAFKQWSTIAAAYGLAPSWGKVQFASQYLNINSMPFEYVPEGFDVWGTLSGFKKPKNIRCYWRKIPFINYGILNGMTRSAETASVVQRDKQSRTYGSLARELLANCPESLKPRILWRFIANNWKALQEAGVPWFMPEWMGGVGLPPLFTVAGDPDNPISVTPVAYHDKVSGKKFTLFPTDLDLKTGYRILRQWPLVQPKTVPVEATWQMHEIAMGLMPEKPSVHAEMSDKAYEKYQERYSQVYGRLCVQAAFSSRLRDIHVEQDSTKKVNAVLRHNRNLWRSDFVAPGAHAAYYMSGSLPKEWVLETRPLRKPIVLFELAKDFREAYWTETETYYPPDWQQVPLQPTWSTRALDNSSWDFTAMDSAESSGAQ